jgi:hypothetical protein
MSRLTGRKRAVGGRQSQMVADEVTKVNQDTVINEKHNSVLKWVSKIPSRPEGQLEQS